jgi:hypothetical protein
MDFYKLRESIPLTIVCISVYLLNDFLSLFITLILSLLTHLTRFIGRAEVAMTFKKADGTQYDVDGKLYDQVDIRMVIDGYNAPLTGGNFIDLIDKVGLHCQRALYSYCFPSRT